MSWSRALSLSERDSIFTQHPPEGLDQDLAKRRLEQWRKESALQDDERLALSLEQRGMDSVRFLEILGSPAPALAPGEHAPWWQEMEAAYRDQDPGDEMPIEAAQKLDDTVLLKVVRPLLDRAYNRLKARLNRDLAANSPAFDLNQFADLWAKPLPKQLLWMVSGPLALELYLQRLEGKLNGSTPEERFEDFLAPYREPAGTLAFLATYPVLARCLANRVVQWLDTGTELAQRLHDDFPALERANGGPLGSLTGLRAGLSDRHDHGRTTAWFEFSKGGKLIYKPRSLALAAKFQDLLNWLGKQEIEPCLRTLWVLDRGDYGWMECVEPGPCRTPAEVERFYARQGIYLAVLHALGATDFHSENLIAAGEYPVLIDLETLFQPMLADPALSREDLNPVATTILRSGLLPYPTRSAPGVARKDLSGLGGSRSQLRPFRELDRVGTDEMTFVDHQKEVPVGQHRPTLDGKEVDLSGMADLILENFTMAYRRLCTLRSEFLRPGGWIDQFAGLKTRVVMRPTEIYGRLIFHSYHPDYLQDALHRERLFDKLWLDAELLPYIPQLIKHERDDLQRGDIPRFASRTDSRDLFSTSGACLKDALPESGSDLVRRTLEAMSERDLERQLALARLALTAITPIPKIALESAPLRPLPLLATDVEPPSRDAYLAAAHRIGERLEVLAFRDTAWISWFYLRPDEERLMLEPVGHDLYSGLAGIALFTAVLGRLSNEARFTQLAEDALQTARERHERLPEAQQDLGGYSGLGGWIYTTTFLGALWQRPELFDEAEKAAATVHQVVAVDDKLDIIAGAAGCLAGLLALQHCRPSEATFKAAIACGEHLVERAEPQARGWGWRIPTSETPLTGFAHGAAGIAWALARLAVFSGDQRFADASLQGLAYERDLFLPPQDNWPDLRQREAPNGEVVEMHAWCHGAPGIGLSRLGILELWDDEEIEREIRAAVRSTRALGFGGNHCLCHGDLGNVEFLARAGEKLQDLEIQRAATDLGGQILAEIERDGCRCGLRGNIELPGLMNGLAGVGYGLLRLASPETVPSILLFETPPTP